jgi:hypothetical protein
MIPVVFIHSGNSYYLKDTILQACKNNKVILLGDDASRTNISHSNLSFFNLNTYDKYALHFVPLYEHLSFSGFQYELFCFLRWFILKAFMEAHKLDTVFYVDSDVLLYVDVNVEYPKYNQYDFTLLHRTAAISSFITKRGINNFCKYVTNIYSNKNDMGYMMLKSKFELHQKLNPDGGVCDMTLLDGFHYNSELGGPGRVGEMMTIINNSTYDHNINTPDQDFEYEEGIKKVQLVDQIPHVYNHRLNKLIKFNSLHLQGSAKKYISKFTTNE